MAFAEFGAHGGANLLENYLAPQTADVAPASQFAADEWSVIALARRDHRSSILPESRIGRFFRALFGLERKNPLSNPRLEALRRLAVLGWHDGYNIAPSEIRKFLSAGFSMHQFGALLDRIAAMRAVKIARNRR